MADNFFSFELKGAERVARVLGRLIASIPQAADEEMGNFAKRMRVVLKGARYPPKRPGQTYVRTGRLANSWRAEKITQARWRIANSARYSGWVVGDKQAWMHRGRWWKASDIIRRNFLPDMIDALARRFLAIWRD